MFFTNEKIMSLQGLYESNETARSLLDNFAERERSSKKTSVDRAEAVTGEDYYSIVSLFKELESIGVGKFVVGRKGHESRMIWSYDIISIGQAARSDDSELESVPNDAEEDDGKADSIQMQEHQFYLRQDLKLELFLPVDFNSTDAHKMKAWLDFITI